VGAAEPLNLEIIYPVYMSEKQVAFWSQSELLQSIKIALIGWKKADPLKNPLLFWTIKWVLVSND